MERNACAALDDTSDDDESEQDFMSRLCDVLAQMRLRGLPPQPRKY